MPFGTLPSETTKRLTIYLRFSHDPRFQQQFKNGSKIRKVTQSVPMPRYGHIASSIALILIDFRMAAPYINQKKMISYFLTRLRRKNRRMRFGVYCSYLQHDIDIFICFYKQCCANSILYRMMVYEKTSFYKISGDNEQPINIQLLYFTAEIDIPSGKDLEIRDGILCRHKRYKVCFNRGGCRLRKHTLWCAVFHSATT